MKFQHMCKIRIPEAVVEKEIAKIDADGDGSWEMVGIVQTTSISGDRAVSLFFKRPLPEPDVKVEMKVEREDRAVQAELSKKLDELRQSSKADEKKRLREIEKAMKEARDAADAKLDAEPKA